MESRTFGRSKKSHRKQFFLFGIAVLLPALVLLFFTLRINRQDREQQIQRAAEARQKKSEVIGRYLADRLDSMEQALRKEILADPSIIEKPALLPPELLFIGRITQQELQMPWEILEKQMMDTNDPLLIVFRNKHYSDIVRRELYKIYPELKKIDTSDDE